MVAAALALLLALAWGGVRYPWTSPIILGFFAASAALWLAFGWRLLHAAEPFIPLTMLAEPVVLGISLAGFFSIGTIVGLSIFIPIYVELVLQHSPSASGLVLIAFMVGATVGSMVAGSADAKARSLQACAGSRDADRHRVDGRVCACARRSHADRGHAFARDRRRRRGADVAGHDGYHPERGSPCISSASRPAR